MRDSAQLAAALPVAKGTEFRAGELKKGTKRRRHPAKGVRALKASASSIYEFFCTHAFFRPAAMRPRELNPPPETAAEKGERSARADVATSRAKAEGWARTGQPKQGHRRGRELLAQPAARGKANVLRVEWKRGRAARR